MPKRVNYKDISELGVKKYFTTKRDYQIYVDKEPWIKMYGVNESAVENQVVEVENCIRKKGESVWYGEA